MPLFVQSGWCFFSRAQANRLLDSKACLVPCHEAARDLCRPRRKVAFERIARWQR